MRKQILLGSLVIAAFFFSEPALADEPQLSASVDKESARIDDEIHLNVRITGVRGSLQAPRLPALEGFEIFYSGRASRFSFVNGRSESMTEFNYVLVPKSPGRFILRPIEVHIGDKVYRTNEVEIQVEANLALRTQPQPVRTPRVPFGTGGVPRTTGPSAGSAPSFPASRASTLAGDLDENIFLRALPSQWSVYTNQQIILTYSLFTRYDTRYEGFIEEPETSGFWVEEFPMDQNIGRDTEVIDGKIFVEGDSKPYYSPSDAARSITYNSVNGWLFWGLRNR